MIIVFCWFHFFLSLFNKHGLPFRILASITRQQVVGRVISLCVSEISLIRFFLEISLLFFLWCDVRLESFLLISHPENIWIVAFSWRSVNFLAWSKSNNTATNDLSESGGGESFELWIVASFFCIRIWLNQHKPGRVGVSALETLHFLSNRPVDNLLHSVLLTLYSFDGTQVNAIHFLSFVCDSGEGLHALHSYSNTNRW